MICQSASDKQVKYTTKSNRWNLNGPGNEGAEEGVKPENGAGATWWPVVMANPLN